ncbi:unnamed protein product, partial [Ectocarpus sp. 13 AM-2016]
MVPPRTGSDTYVPKTKKRQQNSLYQTQATYILNDCSFIDEVTWRRIQPTKHILAQTKTDMNKVLRYKEKSKGTHFSIRNPTSLSTPPAPNAPRRAPRGHR